MTPIIRKTYPELTPEATDVQDADLVAIYRSPGPLKKLAASVFGDYVVKTLESFIQAGTGAVARALQSVIRDMGVNVRDFGAVGDGVNDDGPAIQRAADAAGPNGRVFFPKTATNLWLTSQELFYDGGQTWVGQNGVNILASPTRIRLTAAANGVLSSRSGFSSVTYGPRFENILFDAQGFGDWALSLANTSYAKVDHCGGITSKAAAATFLLDSNVGGQCYFNEIRQPRLFAAGAGGVCIRATRGANGNQIIGGKVTGVRGVECLSLSADNLFLAVDFEELTDRCAYLDAPSNKFIACRMEVSPIGYDITALAGNTSIVAPSFATSVVVQVQDASKLGSSLYSSNAGGTERGTLKVGPLTVTAAYLSGASHINIDPALVSASGTSEVRWWLNTNTTGLLRHLFYKGNGTSQVGAAIDSLGNVQHGDLTQEAGPSAGVYRKLIRRTAPPATAASVGDVVLKTNPAAGTPSGWGSMTTATPGDYLPISIYPGATLRGDVAATLTAGVDNLTQLWNTPLTAPRAVTLSTTGVWAGARFRIVRSAAATGAFNLNVGTGPLKALAVGQWCDVEYVGSAWVLTGFGSL